MYRSSTCGRSIAVFAPAKSEIARSVHRAAATSYFLTATAWRGRISSRTHRGLAEPGWFVTGNRALLTATLTQTVLSGSLEPERWGLPNWFAQRLGGGLNRLAPVLRLPLGPLRKMRPQAWEGARSCNLAVWRSDLDLVDGFDANFCGWGKEDSDLLVRLLHAGVRRKDGAYATGVLHLWHPAADRAQLADNEERLAQVIAGRRVRAERGLTGTL